LFCILIVARLPSLVSRIAYIIPSTSHLGHKLRAGLRIAYLARIWAWVAPSKEGRIFDIRNPLISDVRCLFSTNYELSIVRCIIPNFEFDFK